MLVIFFFAVNTNFPCLLLSFHLLYLFCEFAQHFLLIFTHHFFLHFLLLHYLLTFCLELLSLFSLYLLKIFCQFLLFFFDHCYLLNQNFREKYSQTWVEKSSEEIPVLIFSIEQIKSEYFSNHRIQKSLHLRVPFIR